MALKDGFCVSCDRESSVLGQSCPFCGEGVWHPVWRRVIRVYVLYILPLFLIPAVVIYRAGFRVLWDLCNQGAWYWQMGTVIFGGLLLTPRHDEKLILTSSKGQLFWLLNSLAASVLLLLCAGVSALILRRTACLEEVDWLAVLVALTGMMLVPFALNSGWWRVLLAGLLTLGLLLV